MEFEWDEEKRELNLQKHGVDFVFATLIFDGTTVTNVDDRKDYGEPRSVVRGMIDGKLYVVVHTERNGRIRIISAWEGGRKDYAKYKDSIP